MKFGEQLNSQLTPEWRTQYLNYEILKSMMYNAVAELPSSDDPEGLERFKKSFDEGFFQKCSQELRKIENFFFEKLSEAKRKFETLEAELKKAKEQPSKRSTFMRPAIAFLKESQTHKYRLAFSEFYLSLVLLQNFQALNATGFRKIFKKHDKLLETTTGVEWRDAHVTKSQFKDSKEVDKLLAQVEYIVTEELEEGNHKKAMKQLRVPPLERKEYNPWTVYRVGLFCGGFIVLFAVNVVAGLFYGVDEVSIAIRLFRPFLLIFLECFIFGINVYAWRCSGVNHVLIFELNPRKNMSFQQVLEIATFLACVWSLCLLAYFTSRQLHMTPYVSPLVFLGLLFIFMVNPFNICYRSGRFWLIKVMFKCFTVPFHVVKFADFWLADQMNSLAQVFVDFQFLICFYATEVNWTTENADSTCDGLNYGVRSICLCIPATIRFLQCVRRYRDSKKWFPHLVNAGKYSTTIFVVLFSSLAKHMKNLAENELNPERQNNFEQWKFYFIYFWIVSALTSTVYAYIWDIKMDWGLFDRNAGDNRFLREQIVYRYKAYYYLAIVGNIVLRFGWVLTFSTVLEDQSHLTKEKTEIYVSVVSFVEICRRCIWNFFRLENEHLNNCGEFRAVRDIGLAPIAWDDFDMVSECMDSDEKLDSLYRAVKRAKADKNKSKAGSPKPVKTQKLVPKRPSKKFGGSAENLNTVPPEAAALIQNL